MLPCNDDVPIMELALPCGGEGSCQSFETRGYFGPYPVGKHLGVLASMWLPSHDKYARRMQVLVLHVTPPLDVTLTQQMLPVAPQHSQGCVLSICLS